MIKKTRSDHIHNTWLANNSIFIVMDFGFGEQNQSQVELLACSGG